MMHVNTIYMSLYSGGAFEQWRLLLGVRSRGSCLGGPKI